METIVNIAEMEVLLENIINNSIKNLANNEYKVMLFIKIYKVCTPRLLIDKIGILKTNLALVFKKLISRNLVCVEKSSQDRRSKQYSLTPEGEKVIDNIIVKLNKKFSSAMSEEFVKSVKVVLSALNKKI